MANKRRAHKIKAPYKKFSASSAVGVASKVGTAADFEADGNVAVDQDFDAYSLEKPLSQLVLLSRGTKARPKGYVDILPGNSKLPLEILFIIAGYVEDPTSMLLVNRLWYISALPRLYRRPTLSPRNFEAFVDAISANRRFGSYVESLNLSGIIQSGKNSSAARLLRRCSLNLLEFVAPQSHFGFSPLLALRSCSRLRVLDLGLVSETVDLIQLFKAIDEFSDLEAVNFPRSSILCERYDFKWPSRLRSLGLAGGLSPDFVEKCEFPSSITRLSVSNCPHVTTKALMAALERLGPQLKHLTIEYPLPQLDSTALDTALAVCPQLSTLRASVDYLSKKIVAHDVVRNGHPLRTLTLVSSGMLGHTDKIKPGAIFTATEHLIHLRHVRVSVQLGWSSGHTEAIAALGEVLEERNGGIYVI